MHLSNDRKRQSHKILNLGSQKYMRFAGKFSKGTRREVVIIIVIIISLKLTEKYNKKIYNKN